MNKEDLIPWVDRLNAEPDGKKRNNIVAELCKEKGLNIGDAWNFLKEAGFHPKAGPEKPEGAGTDTGAEAQAKDAEEAAKAEAAAKARAAEETARAEAKARTEAAQTETRPAILRHKTQYPKYRCAALVLTQKAETYQVTTAQLEKLRSDPWVVIEQDGWSK
jgi:hypothetical protein